MRPIKWKWFTKDVGMKRLLNEICFSNCAQLVIQRRKKCATEMFNLINKPASLLHVFARFTAQFIAGM